MEKKNCQKYETFKYLLFTTEKWFVLWVEKRRLSHHGAHALLKPKSGDFKNNEVTWAPAAN